MKMTKIFAALAAAAVSASSFAAMTFSSASAAGEIAVAQICGQFGTYQYWGPDKVTGACSGTSAAIDGNAQYQATISIDEEGGSETMEFLILEIKGANTTADNAEFTSDMYPDLNITVDSISVDGAEYSFTDNADAYKLAWYEGSGHVRIFLTDTWNINGGNDLGLQTTVTDEIKVVFTVSGLYNDGTSNVTEDAPVDEETDAPADEETDAPTDEETDAPADEETDAPAEEETDAPADEESSANDEESSEDESSKDESSKDESSEDESSKKDESSKDESSKKEESNKDSNGGKNEQSAGTGVAGVGMAVAGIALAVTAAVVSRKRK